MHHDHVPRQKIFSKKKAKLLMMSVFLAHKFYRIELSKFIYKNANVSF